MAEAQQQHAQIQGFLSGGSLTSPSAEQVLAWLVAPYPARVRVVACAAQFAGTSTTIIDFRINGSSAYTDPSHRPTLLPGESGAFTSYPPDKRAIRRGDILQLIVAAATAGGPTQVVATAALEEP